MLTESVPITQAIGVVDWSGGVAVELPPEHVDGVGLDGAVAVHVSTLPLRIILGRSSDEYRSVGVPASPG